MSIPLNTVTDHFSQIHGTDLICCFFRQSHRRPAHPPRLFPLLSESSATGKSRPMTQWLHQMSSLLRSCGRVLSALVENLACTLCGSRTLIIRASDQNLGMICKLQTFCKTCEEVINSTHSSDRVGGSRSLKVPFVVTRSAVSAAMDAGVGYAGLDKFCRFLDMPVLHPKTFNTHVKAIADARVAVTDTVMAGAARTVREVHALLRPAGDDNAMLDLTVGGVTSPCMVWGSWWRW